MECQIAKVKGCYVIGSAGSKEKMSWLVNNAGVDYAFNYKGLGDENISTELKNAYLQSSPEEEGIDLYFDNVRGKHLEAALGLGSIRLRFTWMSFSVCIWCAIIILTFRQ